MPGLRMRMWAPAANCIFTSHTPPVTLLWAGCEGADAPRPEEETPCSRPYNPDPAACRLRRRRRR